MFVITNSYHLLPSNDGETNKELDPLHEGYFIEHNIMFHQRFTQKRVYKNLEKFFIIRFIAKLS